MAVMDGTLALIKPDGMARQGDPWLFSNQCFYTKLFQNEIEPESETDPIELLKTQGDVASCSKTLLKGQCHNI